MAAERTMGMRMKGQAAMEYLTTYGWAILVVVLVLVALAWMGVFRPQERIQERCSFPLGTFACSSMRISGDGTQAYVKARELESQFDSDVVVCGFACSAQAADVNTGLPPGVAGMDASVCLSQGDVGALGPYSRGQVKASTNERTVCYDAGGASGFKVGDKYLGRVYVQYAVSGDAGKARVVAGDVIAQVQPA